jgi:catechol 2,3-dioxygenase-like lactoylglutathione lyase family enzyme
MKHTSSTSEISVASLGNIAFWCSNFEETRHFYTHILGIPELGAGTTPRHWVIYGDGGFSFSFNQAEFDPGDRGWPRCPLTPALGETWEPYITVYVPDLETVMDRCRNSGIVLRTEDPFSLGEGFGTSIEVRDPDGNTIAVTERPLAAHH